MKTIEVKKTDKKGYGVYALKEFKKGDTILFIGGIVWEREDTINYPHEFNPKWNPIGRRENMIQFLYSKDEWIYINHHCNSNCGLINDRELVAKKDIKIGEEITQDYSTLDIEAINGSAKELEMKCQCGYEKCRKIITTFDRLPKEKQDELYPYLNSSVKEMYNL